MPRIVDGRALPLSLRRVLLSTLLVLAVWVTTVSTAAAGGQTLAVHGPVPEAKAGHRAYSARQLMVTPGRVIVEYRAGSTAASREAVAASAGARVAHMIPARWLRRGARLAVVVSATESTGELVRRLAGDPAVVYAEPDVEVTPSRFPDDPGWDDLWGMRQIGAPRVWDTLVGSPGVVVADIDTGVDYTHEDLAANMWRNAREIPGNGIDDDGNGWVDDIYGIDAAGHDGDPMDDAGHGTHTSGTIAGVGDNGIGVAGVSWNTKIMALKFITAQNTAVASDAVVCIDYILDQKAKGADVVAVNASWNLPDYSVALKDAIDALGDAGVVFCAAAGNDLADIDAVPSYPVNYACDNLIGVAATDRQDELAFFSDFGPRNVDIAAPGVDILSTWPGGRYEMGMGTSMATPHVAGAVALLAAQHRAEDTPARIKGRLMSTVVDLGLPVLSGGRLDLAAAVAAPTDTRPPRCGVRDATVTGGRLSHLRLLDSDALSPRVRTTLSIADNDGSLRQRMRWEYHESLEGWWTTSFACRLPAGTYRMWVTSTDLSGNQSTSGKAVLRVR